MSRLSPIVPAYRALLGKGRLRPDEAQQALVNQLAHLQQAIVSSKHGIFHRDQLSYPNGMWIHGGVGTGKSQLADLFAITLPRTVQCRRIHFHEFMVDVHSRLHRARSKSTFAGDPLVQIGQEIKHESSIICFDEFQVSDIADAMILKRLFDSFWRSGGIMVATSNRHPSQLYLNGLNRALFVPFIKELESKCLVWELSGKQDYRLGTADSKRVPVFFTDADAFNKELLRMTNDTALEATTIPVAMNRSLAVSAAGAVSNLDGQNKCSERAVVHGTFHEFCEIPLGASDYHALCHFAGTIFISNIRPFGTSELDYVRRLITLIDIAYEARTRIICSSTSPLEDIFKDIGIDMRTTKSDPKANDAPEGKDHVLTVKGEGGSSSSMMSTYIGGIEWSATGLIKASLADGGAGETDVRFAVGRAISRLSEMSSADYGMDFNYTHSHQPLQ